VEQEAILSIVLRVVEQANLARVTSQRLEVSPTAPLFGPASPLDSLGLVGLLIDIEEAFDRAGHPVTLSDERALSQTRSPFRDIPALVSYLATLTRES
jgi:acyl carrier protein